MKANELRIGNYVISIKDGKETIVKINSGIEIDELIASGVKQLFLTEKRIEQFGFKQVSENRWALKNFHGFELIKLTNAGECFTAVKYTNKNSYYVLFMNLTGVHQLQNLYFAMHLSELRIEK